MTHTVYSQTPRWTLLENAANVTRLLTAVAWTAAWGAGRFLKLSLDRPDYLFRDIRSSAFGWKSRNSPKPVTCGRCGWAGAERWVFRAIRPWQDDLLLCPRCSGESIRPFRRSTKIVEK